MLRDDHEAALARADALQAELERERNAQAEQGDRIAKLESELREARSRLERAEETLGDIKPRRPDPEPSPSSTTETTPDEDATAKIGLLVFGLVGIIIFVLAISRCSAGGSSSTSSEPAIVKPTPPFVADKLMKEGIARVGNGLFVSELSFDYVRSDGTLDPEYGRITIETKKPRPPKPPDDPNRPTGAPDPNAGDPMIGMMMMDCPTESWSPMYGWQSQRGSCMSFGDEAVGQPRCTPASIVGRARADGAPEGLARIHVQWTYNHNASGLTRLWRWSYAISDDTRDVNFSKDYEDGDCTPPPVEK